MTTSYDIINRLTEPDIPPPQRGPALHQFAHINGWVPSGEIPEYPGTESLSNGHLVVEHGLDNTAVITFLKRNKPFTQLTIDEKLRLLSISYNNLVECHFFPDTNGLTFAYNRTEPIFSKYLSVHEHESIWRAEAFDTITAYSPKPNLRSLDDTLIETLSYWKRALAAELGKSVNTESISVLFNCLLFVRALEDQKRWEQPNTTRILIEKWSAPLRPSPNIRSCFKSCLRTLGVNAFPSWLVHEDKLQIFDALDRETVSRLLYDFYDNRFCPYQYDFSLMSKHALSRIYERYVSLLRRRESPQMLFFADLPEEVRSRAFGEVYTPQYIAGFFARFLKENLTPKVFRNLKTIDPACGSGIFLRTILELQCDPRQKIDMRQPTENAFKNTIGIDIEENACQATRLSLSLLYLVLMARYPRMLKIFNEEAIDYYLKNPNLRESHDVVITNPPFIPWDRLPSEFRNRVRTFMGNYAKGKVDMFLAHLKLGLEIVKPGGFVMYVLPHSFLLTKSAEKLRKEIASKFWIRFLADLSEIPVFENLGSYVVLLILQKKPIHTLEPPNATIVRCKEFVGHALQKALEGKKESTNFYEIYEVKQTAFAQPDWIVLPAKQQSLQAKMIQLPSLAEFLVIRAGFITGANDVFIRDVSNIPPGENAIYAPYLSDRQMQRFTVPPKTGRVVFYPYLDKVKISEKELKEKFPKTWQYLNTHRKILETRKSGNIPWWQPTRPRPPKDMLCPKIVSPHLILLSRFSLDDKGRYAITRSPLLYPKKEVVDQPHLLNYFLAVLNSSVIYWQLANLSHKYSKGYLMLEPKILKKLKVPSPNMISPNLMKSIQSLVAKRLRKVSIFQTEAELDRLVADLYDLTHEERKQIGMEE